MGLRRRRCVFRQNAAAPRDSIVVARNVTIMSRDKFRANATIYTGRKYAWHVSGVSADDINVIHFFYSLKIATNFSTSGNLSIGNLPPPEDVFFICFRKVERNIGYSSSKGRGGSLFFF